MGVDSAVRDDERLGEIESDVPSEPFRLEFLEHGEYSEVS